MSAAAVKTHPTAVVHASARLGEGVEIGPYAVLGEGVELGEGTRVGAHAFVERTLAGRENRIHPHAVVGTPPQDVSFTDAPTRVVLGDRNVIREFVTVNRGTVGKNGSRGETRLGSGCMLMAYSHVAHDCVLGDGVIMANSATLAGHCEVGSGAFLSGLMAVHQFVRIGRLAIVSGGTMAPKDVPPFMTASGDRARLRGLNLVGLRRGGVPRESIAAIKAAYKTLFLSGLPLEEALKSLETGESAPEVRELAAFIRASKRGVTRAGGEGEAED